MRGKGFKHRSDGLKTACTRKKREAYERLAAVLQDEGGYEEIGTLTRQSSAKETEWNAAISRGELRKHNRLLTAAIDFGTTYSGYAFSFATDPSKVYAHCWDGKHIKTPTAILMNSEKRFAAFGSEARAQYVALIKAKETQNWYYFEKFKMELPRQKPPLNRDMTLEDMTGKSKRALDIFAAGIKYLKNHLLHVLNEKSEYVSILAPDIHWVLTVPAIWNDSAKQFMREAAREAGIDDDSLTIALEPEVASMYCKAKAKAKENSAAQQDSAGVESFQPGTK